MRDLYADLGHEMLEDPTQVDPYAELGHEVVAPEPARRVEDPYGELGHQVLQEPQRAEVREARAEGKERVPWGRRIAERWNRRVEETWNRDRLDPDDAAALPVIGVTRGGLGLMKGYSAGTEFVGREGVPFVKRFAHDLVNLPERFVRTFTGKEPAGGVSTTDRALNKVARKLRGDRAAPESEPRVEEIRQGQGKTWLHKAGETAFKYWDEQERVIDAAYPQKDITRNPEVLADPKYWLMNVPQAVTSMSGAMVAGGGTPLGGAVMGSLMEAGPLYKEMVDAGDEDAAAKAVMFGMGVAALEKVGLEKIFKGANKHVITRALAAGLAESGTEWAEEPLGAMVTYLGRQGITPTEYGQRVLEAMRQGINAMPASFVTGGLGGAAPKGPAGVSTEVEQMTTKVEAAPDAYAELGHEIVEAPAEPTPAAAEPIATPAELPAEPAPVTEEKTEPAELKQGQTVFLGRRKSGVPYKRQQAVQVLQVLDEDTVRIQRGRKVQDVQRDQLDVARAEEGARRRQSYLAGLIPEERAEVRRQERELDAALEKSLHFFPEQAHREIMAAPGEKEANLARDRWIKRARETAAAELGMDDADLADPKVRAELGAKLKEWQASDAGQARMAQAELDAAKAAEPWQVRADQIPEGAMVFADGEWHQAREGMFGERELQDGDTVQVEGFDELAVSAVIPRDAPGYELALSEYEQQEGRAAPAAGEASAMPAERGRPSDTSRVMRELQAVIDLEAGDRRAAIRRIVDWAVSDQAKDAGGNWLFKTQDAYAMGSLAITEDMPGWLEDLRAVQAAINKEVEASELPNRQEDPEGWKAAIDAQSRLIQAMSHTREAAEFIEAMVDDSDNSAREIARKVRDNEIEIEYDSFIRSLETIVRQYTEEISDGLDTGTEETDSTTVEDDSGGGEGRPGEAGEELAIPAGAEEVTPTRSAAMPERTGITPPAAGGGQPQGALQGPHLPIELPELVEMARQLGRGKFPKIVERVRALRGTALGVFYHSERIEMRADLFGLVPPQEKRRLLRKAKEWAEQNMEEGAEEQALMKLAAEKYTDLVAEAEQRARDENPLWPSLVLAHEIGHWVDFLPQKLIQGRGNILGRIASLKAYTKNMILEAPGNLEKALLTDRQRRDLRNKAARLARYMMPKGSSKKAVQAKTKELYQQEIQDAMKRRGLVSRQEIVEELKPLIAWWNDSPTMPAYYSKSSEMYAEAFSVLMNNPAAVHKRAPKFYSLFFNYLENKPQAKKLYEQIQRDAQLGRIQEERDRRQLEAMQKADETAQVFEEELRKMSWREWKDALLMAIDRKFAPVYTRMKKGGQVPAAPKLRKTIADYLYHKGQHKLYLMEMDTKVLEVLREANVPVSEFNLYLQNQHIVHNRANIASMGGMNLAASQQSLKAQEARLGSAAWDAMQRAEAARWEIRQEMVLDPLEESGVLDPELMKVLRSRVKYSTVSAVDVTADPVEQFFETTYGGQVSSGIYRQMGYLGAAKSPMLATAQKDLSLITMLHGQRLRADLREFLAEIGDPMFREATYKWDANVKKRVPKIVDNNKVKTLLYLDKGQVRGYYVSASLHSMLERTNTEDVRIAIKWLRKPTQLLKSLWTSLNYGFWPFNYIRDRKGFVKRMPGVYSRLFGKNAYRKYAGRARTAAASIAAGRPNDLAKQALKRNMIIHTTQWNVDQGEQYDAFEKLMLMHDVDPRAWGIRESKGKRWIRKAWQKYTAIGEKMEREVKIAGMLHLDEKFPGMPEADKQRMVHEFAGSPNFMERGTMNWLIDAIFPFYNPAKQGWRSAWHAAQERPAEWLLKTVKYSVVPKLFISALASGALAALIGEDEAEEIEEMYKSISDYDRTNYDCIPISWVDRDQGKVLYFRMPEEEEERVIGGMLAKILEGNYDPRDLLNFAAGQLPGLNPFFKVGIAWADYASGRQPTDRGQSIIERTRFQAGEGTPEMLKWTANNLGAGLVVRFNRDNFYDPTPSMIQQALNKPVVSNTLGRFLKVSNAGLRQRAREALQPLEQEDAKRRLRIRELIQGAEVTPERAAALMDPRGRRYYDRALVEKAMRGNLDPLEWQQYKHRRSARRAAALMGE